ncbi:LysR family transcriptional regulator [Oricola sp.]|uniref:LysR family transcriptional regulator n=1 Tax=Oricola sp. TaxID=1979950 RepID=UPI0025E300EC|nr:LysR family transcriptional regulator [Oricola sp.]MCI5073847.1 LysR family transcriptional regulator [Oricola sp.]
MTLGVRSAAVILECARRGSLGGAAAALNMTQPAVTRMLKRLEESYGVALFHRTTRGVEPTVFGEALLPYAKLIVSEIGNADDVIRQMRGASRGVVRIGGVGSVVGGFVMAAVGMMREEHPEVQFSVVEDLEDRVLDALKDGRIDIAISPEPYIDDEITLATPEPMHDLVAVFCRAGHPVLDRPELTLLDAARLDWVLPPDATPTVREWQRRFHARSIDPKAPVVVSRSVQVVKSAVLAGDLLCWMPLPLMRSEMERGEIAQVCAPELEWRRTFRIYRRKKGLLTPSAAILIDRLRRTSEAWSHEVR